MSSFILNLIITDSTEESERTWKFLRIGAICTAVNAIASLLIGFWIEYRGFIDLYWTALFVQLLTILLIYNYMRPESLSPVLTNNSHSCMNTTNINSKYKQLIEICTVFSPRYTHRSRKRSISLILTLIAFIFHILASLAFSVPFLWFQLNYPFCWTGKFPYRIHGSFHILFCSKRCRLLQYYRIDYLVYRKYRWNEIFYLYRL